MEKNSKQKGATSIMITLIILTGMLFVVLTVNSIVMNGLKMSRAHLDSAKAYFAAESGTERILWLIRKSDPNEALNPSLDSHWEDGKCVSLDNSSDKCDLECDGAHPHLYSDLGNKSKYRIKYIDISTGSDDFARFETTGLYGDITKRVVQVEYAF